jgi:hypothetical protein
MKHFALNGEHLARTLVESMLGNVRKSMGMREAQYLGTLSMPQKMSF